ncbi:hypothetical protein ACN47E_008608 [Coniothyrium glycines]
MPSQPNDPGWSFSSVYELIDSDAQSISSPTLTPKARPHPHVTHDHDGGITLGSFAKLYESLGISHGATATLPPLDIESELSNSDDALLPSPVLEIKQPDEKFDSSTEDQSATDIGLSKKQRQKARKRAEKERLDAATQEEERQAVLRMHLEPVASHGIKITTPVETPTKPSRVQSRSNVSAKISAPSPVATARRIDAVTAHHMEAKTPKVHRPAILKRSSNTQPRTPQTVQKAVQPSISEAVSKVAQFTTPKKFATALQPVATQSISQVQPSQAVAPLGQGLVPRTVRPVTLPRPSQLVLSQLPSTPTPVVQAPSLYATPMAQFSNLTIRSQVDRHFHLFNKLLNDFPDDRKWLVSPMQMINEKTASHGLHVFVDASNIMIGFKDMLRNHGVPPYQYDMSFDSLALLMERRRPVAKRVFAGSQREANPLPHMTRLVDTSKAVGYDSVMQEQVLIVREDSEKKKFFNDVKKHGWHKANQMRSGSGSDSETGPAMPKTPSAPKWVEQGVDEIIHLKMCQSIIDTEVPSTMVLATGDGAVAEMSDGFLAHVERALKKGWKVELISWGQQTNGGYKNRKFRARWGEQFQILELDDFLEDLIDTV